MIETQSSSALFQSDNGHDILVMKMQFIVDYDLSLNLQFDETNCRESL